MFSQFRYGVKRERGDDEEDEELEMDVNHAVVPTNANNATFTTYEPQRQVRKLNGNAKKQKATASLIRKWQERIHGICSSCFSTGEKCTHVPELRLRLLLVGHNPSDHAWQSGFSYSNPTNHMWSLLTGSLPPLSWRGILLAGTDVKEQNCIPLTLGVGFTSIGLEPGNDASTYGKRIMQQWKLDFYARLRKHMATVCQTLHGHETLNDCDQHHAPQLIAFTGKRQFSWLFTPKLTKVPAYGRQVHLPHDWPIGVMESEVWVLPSSSGRAAMTKQERAQPYEDLASRLHVIPWHVEEIEHVKVETVAIKQEI